MAHSNDSEHLSTSRMHISMRSWPVTVYIKIQLFATSLGELIVKLRIDLSSTTQLQRLRSKAKPVQFSSASNHIMKYSPPPHKG